MKAILRIFNLHQMKDYDLEKQTGPFEAASVRLMPKDGGWCFESDHELIRDDGDQSSHGALQINDIRLIDAKKKLTMLVLKKRNANPLLLKERIYQVGRTKKNVLSLQDRSISASHCAFCKADNEHIYVRDLNSTNGTFVNHRRIKADQSVLLKESDIVNIGSYSLTVINQNDSLFLQLNENDQNVVFHPENTGHDEEISRKYFADIPHNILKYNAGKQMSLDEAMKIVIGMKGKDVLNDADTLKSYLVDLAPFEKKDIDLVISTSRLHYFDDIVRCEDRNLPYVIRKFTEQISSVYAKPVVERLNGMLENAFGISPQDTGKKK